MTVKKKKKERKERSAHKYDFIKILENNKIRFVFCILSRKVTFFNFNQNQNQKIKKKCSMWYDFTNKIMLIKAATLYLFSAICQKSSNQKEQS